MNDHNVLSDNILWLKVKGNDGIDVGQYHELS